MSKYDKEKITYNKLVRDLIPNIIEENNKTYTSHIADEEEYKIELFKKLKEEVDELIKEPCIEEIADVLEVIDAIKKLYKISDDEVERIKKKKYHDQGGFDNRIVLETVTKI